LEINGLYHKEESTGGKLRGGGETRVIRSGVFLITGKKGGKKRVLRTVGTKISHTHGGKYPREK